MKCEMCNQRDAETAIPVEKDGAEDELYVCRECARKERLRRQKKSQRTRKATGLPPGVSLSVTHSGGEPPPQIFEAIMGAMNDMVAEIEKISKPGQGEGGGASGSEGGRRMRNLSIPQVSQEFSVAGRLHLEGLYLIGELEAVHRAFRALGMELGGVELDGVHEAGHAYALRYCGPVSRARRVLADLVRQEGNARRRLVDELPRVLADSLCRSLAILKNCRLLSGGEFFDLLSPLRIGAAFGFLDGITAGEIEEMVSSIDLESVDDGVPQDERDRADAQRADEMNARFEDVMLNERAEDMLR